MNLKWPWKHFKSKEGLDWNWMVTDLAKAFNITKGSYFWQEEILSSNLECVCSYSEREGGTVRDYKLMQDFSTAFRLIYAQKSLLEFQQLKQIVEGVLLSGEKDSVRWIESSNGEFSVKTAYKNR